MSSTLPATPPVIDADAHLTDVPDLWLDRVPAKWRDQVPQVALDEASGAHRWRLGDRWLAGEAAFSRTEGVQDQRTFPMKWADVDPACYDARARLRWMDDNGVFAQALYPNFLPFEGHAVMALEDRELQLGLVSTYNDYIAEWVSPAPERFVLLANVPFWDREATLAEMERCHGMGFKGVIWAATLNRHGLPQFFDPYWDPVYAAAQEMGMSINFHVGVGYTEDDANTATGAKFDLGDVTYRTSIGFTSNARTIAKLILFGVCERFPDLPFVSVESGFGFVPFLVEAMDWQWKHYDAPNLRPDRLLPSEYFRRQIYTMFWFEQTTLAQLPDWADNVMFETDFPHNTSLVQESVLGHSPRDLIEQHRARFDDDVMRKVLWENAAKVYGVQVPSDWQPATPVA